MYCQGPPQGSPALISSWRHGSTCQATYPSHSWCLVTLRELLSPLCVLHPATNTSQSIWVFLCSNPLYAFQRIRTGAYKCCLSWQHGNVLAYPERELHSASPWGLGEDLAWHPLALWATHIFSSFQITEKRYSRWLENITQRNLRSFVRGLGWDRRGS